MNTLLLRSLRVTALVDRLQPLVLLALRLYVAQVFLRSGAIKLHDWGATLALFHDEYSVPLLPPALAAVVGTFGETFFPLLLVPGLAGRFAAAGLFVVNAMAVISYPQLFTFECPAGIDMHVYWGSILLALAVFGPGRWSVDAWILRRAALRPAGTA